MSTSTIPQRPILAYTPKKFQLEPIISLEKYLKQSYDDGAPLIQGGTGSGKTIILAEALKRAQDDGLYKECNPERPFQTYPVFILVPRNAIVQTERVLRRQGVVNCLVTSYDSLRSSLGEMYIDWKTVITLGTEHIIPEWNTDFAPDLIICDEVQYLKNPNSQRSKVIEEFLKARLGRVVNMSATPYQKASEAKHICYSAGLIHTSSEFESFAWQVSPSGPTDNSPRACERIKELLEGKNKYIQVKNVRYPFKPILENKLFDLSSPKKIIYNKAYDRFIERRRNAGKPDIANPVVEKWNAMREFQMCSELLRADELAICAKYVKETHGQSVIIPSNFIATLESVEKWLLKMGVRESEISRLYGTMNDKNKQKSIDDFAIGRTRYFLTTLKSGGTGLNLQHNDVNSYPRTSIMPPCWSVYEFLQFLGRTQRIDNISPARMYLTWYRDTIEEEVATRLQDKYACVRTLYDRADNFIQNIFTQGVDRDLEQMQAREEKDSEEGEELDIVTPEMLDGES